MFTATESRSLGSTSSTRQDLKPIGYDKVRKDTGEHVDPDEIVRGFEIEKGRYVPIDDEDLDRLDIELTHSIDICDFVDLEEIDPIYFRKAYYLAPQDGAEKPYRLLVRALDETGKVGIAKVVIRNKQHLARSRPTRRADARDHVLPGRGPEARRPTTASRGCEGRGRDGEVAGREPERPFKPEKYDDTYRKELLDLIRSKAKGKKLPEPQEEEEAEVIDLMAALRESVEQTKRGSKGAKRKSRKAS